MTGKVFVTQEQQKLNYLPAERYGDVEFITRDEFSPIASSLGNQVIVNAIKNKLAQFNPETDFIVFSGSPVVAAAVFAHLGSRFTRFTVLRWSNRDNIYTPTTVDLSL
jgi:uroporphyrinogen-III decarboxylase